MIDRTGQVWEVGEKRWLVLGPPSDRTNYWVHKIFCLDGDVQRVQVASESDRGYTWSSSRWESSMSYRRVE